jgi:hypothetical protein
VLAESGRARIAERVKVGLARARTHGKPIGRPRIAPATIVVPGGTVRAAASAWGVEEYRSSMDYSRAPVATGDFLASMGGMDF